MVRGDGNRWHEAVVAGILFTKPTWITWWLLLVLVCWYPIRQWSLWISFWTLGTHSNLQVPDLQMSYKTKSTGAQSSNELQGPDLNMLTLWGQLTHICVGNLTIIDSDNGLSPGRRQPIIWTNAGLSLIGPLGPNVSEILAEIIIFSFKKMYLKVLSAKWRPFCLGLNVFKIWR